MVCCLRASQSYCVLHPVSVQIFVWAYAYISEEVAKYVLVETIYFSKMIISLNTPIRNM